MDRQKNGFDEEDIRGETIIVHFPISLDFPSASSPRIKP
jgi:hypothetical protein